MEGKSCVWAEDDVVTAVGIFVLCLDNSGASNFEGGHFILVIFSSVWVELFKVEDLAAFERMFEITVGLLICELLEKRRRIPCDFQRTSLAELALDSATSSGLGRAPRSAMQDPIQAPPGTTRQAGLYTS
ncbi:hypothetical protein TNCV_4329621 [Trichonephila clavipes]|nr:hypothetical protein TNCV_4329621 [Trichonephila clavipes]